MDVLWGPTGDQDVTTAKREPCAVLTYGLKCSFVDVVQLETTWLLCEVLLCVKKCAVLPHLSSSERLESEQRPVRSVVLAMEVFIPSNRRIDKISFTVLTSTHLHSLVASPLMFVLTFMSP